MTTTSAPAKGAQPILFAPVGVGASLRRIGALVRRYTGRAGFRVITATYGSADGAVIDTGTVEPRPPTSPPGELPRS